MRKPCQGGCLRDYVAEKWMLAEIGRCVTTLNEVTEMPKGLCSKEMKVGNKFVFVIRIARWNQVHIVSVPWNNESVTVH